MKLRVRGLALVLLMAAASPASAVDLAAVDRTIAKEPTYQAPSAKYCLVVIGPEAKSRVWLVLDGGVLYVDRNGNGDLTEPGEKIAVKHPNRFEIGDLPATNGKPKCSEMVVRANGDNGAYTVQMAIDGKDWSATCQFGDRSQNAPVLHFDGPLALLPEPPAKLTRGEKKSELTIRIGTPGLGKDSFASVRAKQAVPNPKSTLLVADIEFPNKVTGSEPIKTQLTFPPPGG